jgi:zinc protease
LRVDFERFQLDNGLRVVLAEDRTNPVVAVNLWYDVGSRNEQPGRTGFAHLFEHMMFQGSANVPDTQHIAHIERVGGSMNGSTWLDRTNYFQTVPSHWLDLALWLESDRMGHFLPALTQEKLDNQRDVVKNERRWRVDNRPYGDWDERLQAMVYPPDHPYHHSVIGSMADLDAATLEDVSAFFRTYYSPNNAVLTLCGDFDHAAARASIETWFGAVPRGPEPPPLPGSPAIDAVIGREVRERIESDVALPRVYLAFRIPPLGSDEFPSADVTANLLATGKASRLYETLIREREIAQDAVAYAFPIVTGAAMLVVWATARPETSPEALERALLAELSSLATEPVPEEEVQRAIAGIESRHVFGLQQVGERADQLSMYTTLFDDPDRLNREIDEYRRVTPDSIREFASAYLHERNRVVLTYVPRNGGSDGRVA